MNDGIKRRFFEAALCECPVVQVTLIVIPGLALPPEAKTEGVVLEYGDQHPGVRDLRVSELGITATLSFRGQPHPTFVPWAAVVRMTVPRRFIVSWPLEEDFVAASSAKGVA